MARSLPLVAVLLLGALAGCAESIVAPPTPPAAPAAASPIQMTCDPSASDAPCDDEGTGAYYPPPPGLLVSGVNPTMCADGANYPDSDFDQLNDVCEEALAAAFAPTMMQWTDFEKYDHQNGWTGGEYYHGVVTAYDCANSPYCTAYTRIAYMPAYYGDGGEWTCGGFRMGCGHDGDSEFLMVDLAFDSSTGRYRTVRTFFSAHCGASLWLGIVSLDDPDCRWRDASSMEFMSGIAGGAPVVWAAASSNANYPSESACNGGTNMLDVCRNAAGIILPYAAMRFPVSPDYNVGSYIANVGYVHGRRNPAMTDPNRTEPFFTDEYRFRGWQGGDQAGETSYGNILRKFGFGSPYSSCAQGSRLATETGAGLQPSATLAARGVVRPRGRLRPTTASRIEYVPGGGC